MKTFMMVLAGAGCCASVAFGVWMGERASGDAVPDDTTAARSAPAVPQRAASADQASGLWAWGNVDAGKTKARPPVTALLAKALTPSATPQDGEEARTALRTLARQDPAVMQQLIDRYDKESNTQSRQLIASLLSGIEKPEVLNFSKRLAASRDMGERRDGFVMLQNLNSDAPEVHPVILQALSGDKAPEVIMLALAALKPPAEADPSHASGQPADAAAIVAQLQNLTRNADPNIRLRSILQLAQWDTANSSQEQWSQALADQSPQVRQAAVTAVAQNGAQSDAVKAALMGLVNNQNENKDVRGNALQVLARFTLSRDEAASLTQLRAQILGS
jgi:hypothetical protein